MRRGRPGLGWLGAPADGGSDSTGLTTRDVLLEQQAETAALLTRLAQYVGDRDAGLLDDGTEGANR